MRDLRVYSWPADYELRNVSNIHLKRQIAMENLILAISSLCMTIITGRLVTRLDNKKFHLLSGQQLWLNGTSI